MTRDDADPTDCEMNDRLQHALADKGMVAER